MKKNVLFFALIVCCVICNRANAQATRVEKLGVVLTRADSSREWFLENTTNDSLKIFVVNHQDRVEELPGGVIAVSSGDHQEVTFTIGPKQKLSLDYRICYHSTGLMVGTKSDATLIAEEFYAKK